jgi:hypothetical protein
MVQYILISDPSTITASIGYVLQKLKATYCQLRHQIQVGSAYLFIQFLFSSEVIFLAYENNNNNDAFIRLKKLK